MDGINFIQYNRSIVKLCNSNFDLRIINYEILHTLFILAAVEEKKK